MREGNETAFDDPLFERKEVFRLRAIAAFYYVCQYCHEGGDETNGPDSRPWHLDRIKPGSRGGEYVSWNVTLACSACNCAKKDREVSAKDCPDSLDDAEGYLEYSRFLQFQEHRELQKFEQRMWECGCNTISNDNSAYAGWTCT